MVRIRRMVRTNSGLVEAPNGWGLDREDVGMYQHE